MTLREIVIELALFAIFLGIITSVCVAARVALDASITAVLLGTASYSITVAGRSGADYDHNRDRHL